MYKVVIIDDEDMIRKGLQTVIDWEAYGCVIVGVAEDGAHGAELISKLTPDIILTDIRMPELDGLSMIHEVKSIVPRAKIIILSGFRDFDYAREAISLGAFEYLIKPSNINDIVNVIKRAVKELGNENDMLKEMDKFRILFEDRIPLLKEKILHDIMSGIAPNNSILDELKLYNINIQKFILLVVEYDSGSDVPDVSIDLHVNHMCIIKYFTSLFDEFEVIPVSLSVRQICMIIDINTDVASYDYIFEKTVKFQEGIKNLLGLTISVGISSEGENLLNLHEKLKESQRALKHKLHTGDDSVVSYKDLNLFFNYEDYSSLEIHKSELLEGIQLGRPDIVQSAVNNLLGYFDEKGFSLNNEIKNFYWNIISSINNIRISVLKHETPGQIENYGSIDSLWHLINNCENINDLNDIILDISENAAQKTEAFNNRNISLKVQTIMDFVDKHYAEQITLNDVSESIFVSTYYASRIFKKETGKNFVDYLNEVRIEKAKEFLKDVQYKIYEVADLIGISDAHYFSRLFRKYTGKTPSEYRDLN